jgi:hypothetical protein
MSKSAAKGRLRGAHEQSRSRKRQQRPDWSPEFVQAPKEAFEVEPRIVPDEPQRSVQHLGFELSAVIALDLVLEADLEGIGLGDALLDRQGVVDAGSGRHHIVRGDASIERDQAIELEVIARDIWKHRRQKHSGQHTTVLEAALRPPPDHSGR